MADVLFQENNFSFLQGGGEMGRLIRSFNWSETVLGTPATWPIHLKVTLSNLLRSKFPMFLWWGDELIQFYNDAYRPSLGFEGKHPKALGQRGSECWKETWHRVSPIIETIRSTGEGIFQKNQVLPINRNGIIENVYWTYSYSPVLDEEGSIAGILVTCLETTDMIESQLSSEHSQQELLSLFEESPAAIASLSADEDLTFITANKFYGQLVGRSPDQLIGKPLLEALPEIAGQGFNELLKGVIETKVAFHSNEARVEIFRNEKIETIYVNLTYQPRINRHGYVYGVLVVATDVTQQVVARKKIEQSEKKYRTLFDSMNQGFCVIEMMFDEVNNPVDYKFLEINPVFEAQSGLKNAIGKTARELVPGLEQHWFDFYGKIALTGEAERFEEGSEAMGKWFDVYAFRHGEPEAKQVALLFSDITDRMLARFKIEQIVEQRTEELRQSNDALKKTNNDLERSNAQLEEFAHAASHDLKEPIRKIQFYTSYLKEQLDPHLKELQKNSFDRIERSSMRMGQLIDDLLQYSEVSQKPREKTNVDLNKQLQLVMEDLELDIRQKNAQIHIDSLPMIKGYERQLQQMFQNLVSNALKYSHKDVPPKIEIVSDEQEENGQLFHIVSIKDHGIGIEDIYFSKIFQMFARLHGKQEYSGTGVGLSIVKKVVENHQGNIRVESKPGKGSVFHVYLPAENY